MSRFFLFFTLFSSTLLAQDLSVVADYEKCRIGHLSQEDFLLKTSQQQSFDKRVISPSGRFIFYYDTSGFHQLMGGDLNSNGINDYIDSAMVEMDQIYQLQFANANYPIALADTIPVHFLNLGSGLYGATYYSSNSGFYPYQGKTIMEINTQLNTPPTKGMDMIRVTLAHEFHHVIQLAYGAWLGSSGGVFTNVDFLFYYEMAATFFEEVHYDDINDYYFYLQNGVFQQPKSRALYKNNDIYMYSSALFFVWLRDRYGLANAVEIVHRINKKLPTKNPTSAMTEAVFEITDETLDDLWAEYALATLFTKTRHMPSVGFWEGDKYPTFNSLGTDTLKAGLTHTFTFDFPQTGFHVRRFHYQGTDYPVAFSSGNFQMFMTEGMSVKRDTVLLTFSNFQIIGGEQLSSTIYYAAEIKSKNPNSIIHGLIYDPEFGKILDIPILNKINIAVEKLPVVFPSPINLNKHPILSYRTFGIPEQKRFEFILYDISGKEVFRKNEKNTTHSISYNLTQYSLSTGIYFYAIQVERGENFTGKIAIIK